MQEAKKYMMHRNRKSELRAVYVKSMFGPGGDVPYVWQTTIEYYEWLRRALVETCRRRDSQEQCAAIDEHGRHCGMASQACMRCATRWH